LADDRLIAFIEASLRAGAGRGEIEHALRNAGWSREQIADGLGAFAEHDFVVPVPRPRAQLSARDAFSYLVLFAALYVAAFQLGQLLFQFVNLAVVDELSLAVEAIHGRIRWSTSALIVAYPVFLFMSYRIAVEVARDPPRRNSAVRRWLTYLTLFIAVAFILGDLIALLFGFLSGEVTLRFALKCLIVAALAGAVFGYYFQLMKRDDRALAS